MIFEFSNYRDFLKSTLADRISKNPRYSLRSLAIQLDVAPSSLSEILSGKKNFSIQKAISVASKIGLQADHADYFVGLVELETAKSPNHKDAILRRLKGMNKTLITRDVSVDTFRLISDWYHFPIMEMTYLKNFEFTPRNIAKRLGISPYEAEAAIQRLERLGLIKKTVDSKTPGYTKSPFHLVVGSDVPNAALRAFHKQMLDKAMESIETQTPDEKLIGSETFALNPARLKEAQPFLEEFFEKVLNHFDPHENKSEIYHVGVQLFRLTQQAKQSSKTKTSLQKSQKK